MENHLYKNSWIHQGFQIIECESCGFIHIYPIPSLDDLKKFYRDDYYNVIKPFAYDRVDNAFLERRKEFIRNYDGYIEVFETVMKFNNTGVSKMLDIGCGNELLGKFMQDKGWGVSVVEPHREAGDYLRKFGLKVYNKTIEEIAISELDKVSFINFQFVLEHVGKPIEVLQKLNQLLLPGGIIRVCVPNDFSEGQLAYMENFHESLRWIFLPDHVNYFTFDSLSKLLNKTGFHEVYRTTNFPLEFLLMAGINYYAATEEKAKVGPFIANFEGSLKKTGRGELLKQLYEHLAQLGFGRSIFMYAVKE